MVQRLIPSHCPFQSKFSGEARTPAQFSARLARIEAQKMSLVQDMSRLADPCGTGTPQVSQLCCDARNFPRIVITRTEVECSGELGQSGEQLLREDNITAQGFKYVLPRADGFWITDRYGFAGLESADQIRDQPVCRPITAADDISCSRGRHCDMMFGQTLDGKERATVGGGNDLRAGFARGVWIVAT